MKKVVPNSKFVGHSTEIIRQSKIKGPLSKLIFFIDLVLQPFKLQGSLVLHWKALINIFRIQNAQGTTVI